MAGLYLHIPFCRSKCGYCAFNSITASRGMADEYLDLLDEKIAAYASLPWSREQVFTSIFIGGGTPTLASPEKLAKVLTSCRHHFNMSDQAEISMEANPDSIDQDSLSTLLQAGVNRLSIGVQSFNDTLLSTLNRPHTGQQASQAVKTARKCGFSNINLDLIYGLPGQSLTAWTNDLHQALDLAPEHLALYELTIEPGTPFALARAANTLDLADEELVADMEEATNQILTTAYQRYEISNFTRPGYECRHNINYWQNGSYLGLGSGAVSCLDGLRLSQESAPHRFMTLIHEGKTTISQAECLSAKGRFRESIIMGLRLVEGLDLTDLERRFHLSAREVYGDLFPDLLKQGLLIRDGKMLRLPANLLAVANQILSQLV